MNIAMIGTGYVGLVSGACFAEMGINVTCVDINEEKINMLKSGKVPIYEPNLENLISKNYNAGRMHFTTDITSILDNIEILFLVVGTPPNEDGSADLKHVLAVAENIGKNMSKYILVVTKSTVPVGTAEKIRKVISDELKKRNLDIDFDVASNPEFLKEGTAIEDFMKPDRVVLGVDSQKAKDLLSSLYKPMLINNFRVMFMDITSSEMTKYVANSMLATRISFMNDVANLCELLGADVNLVRQGIGVDSRIGNKFLYAGCGYGGSCFPKDVKALIKTADNLGYDMKVLKSVEEVNEKQKTLLFEKFSKHFNGDVSNKKVAIWGLSFKPGTDDIREAPSLVLIDSLLANNCDITVYDPVAMEEVEKIFGDKIKYSNNIYDAVENAQAIFHITEWKEFRFPNWNKIKSLMSPNPVLIDGRNVYSSNNMEGIAYIKIG